MSILVNRETRVVVQGITGKEGSFHTTQAIEYGTKVVAGVTPGKGGGLWEGKVPVCDTVEEAVKQFPNIKAVATTLREVHSANRHTWSAVLWLNGQRYTAPTCELDVLDRVGGGDGYAAGFIYGLLTGASEQEAVNLGWAHGALLTTFPGDTTMATVAQEKPFAMGASARIQR